MNSTVRPTDVADANRRFYDQIAPMYDRVDSRRTGTVDHSWLDNVLMGIFSRLEKTVGKKSEDLDFLDAGTGSGFLAIRAQKFLKKLTLVDISQAMLDRIPIENVTKLQGDCSKLPVSDQSMDFIGAFATLHHLYSPEEFFNEAYRVLRKGGILYSDHDIESHFVSRFQLPLKMYRAMFDHGHEYLKQCPEASKTDYLLSEYHGDNGLDANRLIKALKSTGFEVVEAKYHWEGMGTVANILDRVGLTKIMKKQGTAPIIRLIAVKK